MASVPTNSLEQLLTARAATEAPGTPEGSDALRQLLLEMHAHESLAGVYRVARHTTALLELAATTPSEKDDAREIFRARSREMTWVNQNIRKIFRQLSGDRRQRERMLRRWHDNPVIGNGATEHGLWCLLWHDHPDPSLAPVFRLLQLKALNAHMAVMRYWSGREEWKPGKKPYTTVFAALYHETLAIRKFVITKHRATYEPILRQLATEKVTVENLAEVLRRITRMYAPKGEEAPSTVFRSLCSILWLLRREQHPERVRRVSDEFEKEILSPSGEIEAPVGDFEPYQLNPSPMDDDPEEGDGSSPQGQPTDTDHDPVELADFTRVQWTAEELATCQALALHPTEVLSSSHLRLSTRKLGPRSRLSWRAKENQLLPWSLHDAPLELAAEALETLRVAASDAVPESIELFALVMTVFRTGTTLLTAAQLAVTQKRPENEDVQTLTLVLGADPAAPAEWVFPALPIPYRGEPVKFDGCREVVSAFVLPDFSRVGDLIRTLVNMQCGGAWDGRDMRPFRRSKKEYERALQECLAGGGEDRELLASCCTFERLSMVRFRRIYQMAAENVVPAIYATLRPHHTGEVPRFYETLPVRTVQELDKKSVSELFTILQDLGFVWKVDESLEPSDTHGDLGSPYCPTVTALKEYLGSLRQKVAEADNDYSKSHNSAFLIQRHNLFTTYTQVGYLIGTGHRAVHGAYTELDEIDPETQLLTIRDKGPRGRQVRVSDIVWTQMRTYRTYLRKFRDLGLITELSKAPIVLLAPNWSVIEVRQTTLGLPWPMNFGRHFVRTEFANAISNGDCHITIEHLKEMLGHAAEGEERDGPCSTFNFRHYSAAMRRAIDELLAKVNYLPIDINGREISVVNATYASIS